ncbi:Ribonuclease BN [Nitrospira tepida]|uniref:Ribonuclease BN n=1 Tax=Nitrospira tepida TaxID=2973512 RepID=A0AA86TDV4_9BACT|nr:YihY/virulence factor BrkB family protein [Nitrospira tepida]CAI4032824.1 Ribonuclease BN [Nitrospira tepida]
MKTGSTTASLDSSSPAYNPWKLGGLTLRELAGRLWHEMERDELLGRGAQLAYYFLLSLFPALIFLTALMGLFPIQNAMPELMAYLQNVLPEDALSLVQRYLEQVVQGSGGSLISLGLLGALWASSSGVTAIIESLNTVYGAKETRPFWKVRLVAILLTIALAGFIILSVTLVLYGEHIGSWIASFVGLGWLFELAWVLFQWPVAIGLMLVALAAVYYFCPDVEQDWRWVTPGSLLAVLLWLIVSLGFKLYVDNFSTYNKVYGSIAGVIVLMLWFYFCGITLLVGGELNAEIEKAARAQRAEAADGRPAALRAGEGQRASA